MKYNDKKMLFGIGIVFLFLATVGFSYAYFTTTLVNKDVKNQIVETGTLQLTYTDGAEIVMSNIKPGDTFTKEINVKNTGTLDASYNLVWQELNNEITKDEMVMSLICERLNSDGEVDGTCNGLDETSIGSNIIKRGIYIEPSVTHKYVVTIKFLNINESQDYNQGKKFSGVLGVNEYKPSTPKTVNCTFDGEMVQGAEYVNGDYTYRYMQEVKAIDLGGEIGNVYDWENANFDGWGVRLTHYNNKNDVTSEVCTYINDKPLLSMSYTYWNARTSYIDTGIIDTSNIINMKGMFQNSDTPSFDLSNFNTSNVTDMSDMFLHSEIKKLDVSNFNTSKVTNMDSMFSSSQVTFLDVSNFNTSNVTNMSGMFANTQLTSLDISSFDTSKVIDMSGMFSSLNVQKINGIEKFNTSNVTDMSGMFSRSKVSDLDLSAFDTSKVTNMKSMFYGLNIQEIKGLEKFDTSKVTNMFEMFAHVNIPVINLSNFDTSNVTNMSYMFWSTTTTKLDVSSFDTSNVTSMKWMFYGTNFPVLDLSSFNVGNVTDMSNMFSNTSVTTGYAKDEETATKFNDSSVTRIPDTLKFTVKG